VKVFEAIHVIRKITYKNDSRIYADYDRINEILKVEVSLGVIDAETGSTTRIQRQEHFSMEYVDSWNAKHCVAIIFELVRKMEIHETIEWFRFQGLRCNRPHPEINEHETLAFGENLL